MKRPINRPFLLTRLLFAVVVCLTAGNAVAQDFSVRSFRTLVNDITAYIDPVRDLNDEACALIKVVGDEDFVFSSPLGIVKRKNEVGEIWIYLPAGSVMMTIKHPRWGVLRDYRFPTPLESRMTYEIRLTPPLDYRRPLEMPELSRRPGSLSVGRPLLNTLPAHPVAPLRRPLLPLESDWASCVATELICWGRQTCMVSLPPRAPATKMAHWTMETCPITRDRNVRTAGYSWPEASTASQANGASTKA